MTWADLWLLTPMSLNPVANFLVSMGTSFTIVSQVLIQRYGRV